MADEPRTCSSCGLPTGHDPWSSSCAEELNRQRDILAAKCDRVSREIYEARMVANRYQGQRDTAVILLRELFNRVGHRVTQFSLVTDIEKFLRQVGER